MCKSMQDLSIGEFFVLGLEMRFFITLALRDGLRDSYADFYILGKNSSCILAKSML